MCVNGLWASVLSQFEISPRFHPAASCYYWHVRKFQDGQSVLPIRGEFPGFGLIIAGSDDPDQPYTVRYTDENGKQCIGEFSEHQLDDCP